MSRVSLLKAIRILDRPVFTARELSAVSAHSFSSVSQSLKRLAREEMVTQIKKGLWADIHSPQFSPLVVINFLLSRHRTYLSFVSALHLHGMVSQIPRVITLASTAHSQVIRTPVGVYSIHQITPSFFGGFDWYQGKGGFLIAEAEKALVDCLYIASRKGRRFASFPELTFPEGFKKAKAFGWVGRISDRRLRVSVRSKLEHLLAGDSG